MLRQFVLCVILAGIAVAGWIAYVPSARELLERAGVLDLIGVDVAEARDDGGEGGFRAGEPVQVATAEVVEAVLDDRIKAIGDGRARRSVEVRSDAAGLITELAIDASRHVAEDEVIARLDDEAEQIALERARIVLADARDELERLSRLRETGAVTAVSLRQAELSLRSAELELRQAEVDLAERLVTAPISGWVGILDIEEGDRVSAQDVLATITDRSQILVDFRVPERVVGEIEVGMPFAATPLAMPDARLSGEISAIDSTIDRTSRTLRVQGTLDNAEDRLRAGMAFSIELTLPGEAYPSIDPLALQWSREGSYVWVVRDAQAARVPVVIHQRNSDALLVEAALEAGDRVVTEGVQTLRPGTEVTVVEPAQAALPTDAAGDDS